MTTQKEPTVYVVDDSVDARETMSLLIRSVGLPVEAFSDAERFLDAYHPDWPGCLLLDVRMPGMSGLDLLEELCGRECAIPVIILTAYADVPTAVRALRNGAVEFLEKPFYHQALLDAVRRALKRDAQDRSARQKRADIKARLSLLTAREREVMELVVDGLPSKAIAARLDLSLKAVEAHRSRIMKKMQAQNAIELVRQAIAATS